MDAIAQFIIENSNYAPWMIISLVLLAGCNIPISIDVVMILSAFLAGSIIPKNTFILYLSLLISCYFSAWINYWIGRHLGAKLLKFSYFSKIFTKKKLKSIHFFYEKYGMLTLLVGRFIPFGIRNCIFFTTGASKLCFKKFIIRDALACFIWATTCFWIYYNVGKNYELLIQKIKMVNLILFATFGIIVVSFLCYKKYIKRIKILDKNSRLDA